MPPLRSSVAVLLGLGAIAAFSQDSPFMMDPGAFANHMAIQPMTQRLERDHRIIFGQSVQDSLRGRSAGAAQTSTVIPAAAYDAESTSRTIHRLVAKLPEGQRSNASAAFKELLTKYAAIEKQFGIPPRDVAGALAAYLAGCHMAYHDTPFPDANFKPLVLQMRQVLASNPAFAQIPAAERQSLYDEMALSGMLMATAQIANQGRADPRAVASLREAAGRQLQTFLGAAPDRVRISGQGLHIQ